MNTTWKAILGAILIFVFGCVCGALIMSVIVGHKALALLQRGPDGVAEVLERRMTRNLSLDSDQKQQVHGFIMENLKQRKELQKTIQPQVQTLNRQTVQQIMTVLRPDQKERFQQNIDRLRMRLGANGAGQQLGAPSTPAAEGASAATNSGASTSP